MASPMMNRTVPATYRTQGSTAVVQLGTTAWRWAARAGKPRRFGGGGALAQAMPRKSRAPDAVRFDEVSPGARARIGRIANRKPNPAVLIASISVGSPSHMIRL